MHVRWLDASRCYVIGVARCRGHRWPVGPALLGPKGPRPDAYRVLPHTDGVRYRSCSKLHFAHLLALLVGRSARCASLPRGLKASRRRRGVAAPPNSRCCASSRAVRTTTNAQCVQNTGYLGTKKYISEICSVQETGLFGEMRLEAASYQIIQPSVHYIFLRCTFGTWVSSILYTAPLSGGGVERPTRSLLRCPGRARLPRRERRASLAEANIFAEPSRSE